MTGSTKAACWQLDKNSWSQSETGSMPRGKTGGVAATDENRLIITSGKFREDDPKFTGQVEYWQDQDWTAAVDLPDEKANNNHFGHCIAYAINNQKKNIIHIIGGNVRQRGCITTGNWKKQIEKEWEILNDEMTAPRKWHSCSTLENKIYVLGGWNAETRTALDSSEILDPVSRQFTCGPKLPRPFQFGESIVYKSALYLFYVDLGEIYRLAKNGSIWEKLGMFPHLIGTKLKDLTGDAKGAIVLKDTTLNC